MDTDLIWLGSIFGFIMGMLFTVVVMTEFSAEAIAISECEQSLPRDQHCKIIAVVDED